MGSIVTSCTCDGDTLKKLKKAEKKNMELKQLLKDAQKSKYVHSEQELQQKIIQLTNEKDVALKQLKSEHSKYVREKKSNKQLKSKINTLSQELDSFTHHKLKSPSVESVRKQEEISEYKEPNNECLSIETTKLFGIESSVTAKQKQLQNKLQQFAEIQLDDLTMAQSVIIQQDIVTLRDWVARQRLSEKKLKVKLAKFLTERNETERVRLFASYNNRYHANDDDNIMDDITDTIKRGNVHELIESLFQTRVQFDASCIRNIVVSKRNKSGAIEIGHILCCREINKLKEICYQYKQLFGAEMKDEVCALVNKRTYKSMVQHLFTFKRHSHKTTDKLKVDAKLQGDLEYLMDENVDWKKHDHKKRVSLMIIGNTVVYVRDLNDKFFKATDKNLLDEIDEMFGKKSLSGMWMKLRIEYCCDRFDFYARKIQIAGDNGWNAAEAKEINRIFISMFAELTKIQNKFKELNYGNGENFKEWIKEKCPNERYGIFLTKMLDNCSKQT